MNPFYLLIPLALVVPFLRVQTAQGGTLPVYNVVREAISFGPPTQKDIDKTAREIATGNIKRNEGLRLYVYLDTLGYPTVGYGHKVTPFDLLKLGDQITLGQANTFLANDIEISLKNAELQALAINAYTPDFIAALTEVNYQLGTTWPLKFTKTWSLLMAHDWEGAANEAQNSLWYSQTPNRVVNFQNAIRRL